MSGLLKDTIFGDHFGALYEMKTNVFPPPFSQENLMEHFFFEFRNQRLPTTKGLAANIKHIYA